jgi:hypothetical protein
MPKILNCILVVNASKLFVFGGFNILPNFRLCVSKRSQLDVGFCAGANDCPGLGIVKKLHVKNKKKHLCA